MKNNFPRNLILFFISVVFSVAFIFAVVELPRLLDKLLHNNVGFPGFDHGAGDVEAYKTELYIQALHLSLIGYISLAIVLVFQPVRLVCQALAFLCSIDFEKARPLVYLSLDHDHPLVRRKAVFILYQDQDWKSILYCNGETFRLSTSIDSLHLYDKEQYDNQ